MTPIDDRAQQSEEVLGSKVTEEQALSGVTTGATRTCC